MTDGKIAQFLGEQQHMTIVQPDVTIAEAAKIMSARRVGAVLVTEHNKLVGIFTERDLLDRVVAAGRNPVETILGEVMTRDPIAVTPETSVMEAARAMREHHLRHLPVVRGDHILGIISVRDMMRAALEEISKVQHFSREFWESFQGIPV